MFVWGDRPWQGQGHRVTQGGQFQPVAMVVVLAGPPNVSPVPVDLSHSNPCWLQLDGGASSAAAGVGPVTNSKARSMESAAEQAGANDSKSVGVALARVSQPRQMESW